MYSSQFPSSNSIRIAGSAPSPRSYMMMYEQQNNHHQEQQYASSYTNMMFPSSSSSSSALHQQLQQYHSQQQFVLPQQQQQQLQMQQQQLQQQQQQLSYSAPSEVDYLSTSIDEDSIHAMINGVRLLDTEQAEANSVVLSEGEEKSGGDSSSVSSAYPFTCDICHKSFKRKRTMLLHVKHHSAEKPYSCDICNKRFFWSGSLSRHQRTHTGEKPYQCKICSRRFTQSGTMNRHYRTHFVKSAVPCEICGQAFSTASDLEHHLQAHEEAAAVAAAQSASSYSLPIVPSMEKQSNIHSDCVSSMIVSSSASSSSTSTGPRISTSLLPGDTDETFDLDLDMDNLDLFDREDDALERERRESAVSWDCDWCGSKWASHAEFIRHFLKHVDDSNSFMNSPTVMTAAMNFSGLDDYLSVSGNSDDNDSFVNF